MILTDAPAHSLSETDLRRMVREKWRFAESAVRVANGWAMLATNPHGRHELVVVADPEQEPEKFRGDGVTVADSADQLDLFSQEVAQ